MYELINIFDVFLPQLLSYPNASDPLNIEAANLLLKNEEIYKEKVKDFVKAYAMKKDTFKENMFSLPKEDKCFEISPKSSQKCIHKVSTDVETSSKGEMDKEDLEDR